MLRKVLYCTDLSELSEQGLLWLAEHMSWKETEFVLLHVVDTVAGVETPNYVSEAEDRLAEASRSLRERGIPVRHIVEAGDEAEVARRIAGEHGCTLVSYLVEPGQDKAGFVRKLALPQLLIDVGEERKLPVSPPQHHVVVATDLDPERTETMFAALENALAGTAYSLTLVHAVPLEDPSRAEELITTADEALQTVKESISSWAPEAATRIESGELEETLKQTIEELDPSLLVLGLSLHSELWQLFVGTTAEVVINESRCPMLIIPV
ncbi:MAG: universal stress protein [Synergistales bacterium]|nr:universal stress protein [Synergistales bacterium]